MKTVTLRGAIGVLLVAGIGLSSAACGDDEPAGDGKVTITVNALPPATDAADRAKFEADVKEFEDKNPNINIEAKEGKMDPQTFPARLAGGQLEDVFYVYFTDPASLIAKRQVSDISTYLKDFPVTKQIKPELMKVFSGTDNKVYGLPWTNYSMGLLYNRKLFTQAGLDPNSPPKTWDEVRAAAKKIAALGNGTVGYGDYSKSNTGGWHFTAEMYSLGGDIAKKDGDTWKAAFNDAKGKQLLTQLKAMRWDDSSMGERQLLEWADLLQMMGAGKLGMYVATSDNIPTIVNQYKGDYADYGLAPIPNAQGTLGGGDGFMFKAGLSPEKIRAGLKWLTFKFNNPDRISDDYKYEVANKRPVGLPEPSIWTGDAASKLNKARSELANVPQANYEPFVKATGIPVRLEPPNAQQIYAVLDVPMQKVLTDRNANIDQLLSDAEKQVNTILAAVK